MSYLQNNSINTNNSRKPKSRKRKLFIIFGIFLLISLVSGGFFLWKTGSVLNKISGGGVFSSILHAVPGVKDTLKGEREGRINIALLGMRGEGVAGGGLLTDTIIIISIDPTQNRVAMISIPRDLYVTVPGTQDKQKINAVHAYGEQKNKGKGLEDMKTTLSEITGLSVDYAASINFAGFKQLIDTIGGVEITLDQPFTESLQFKGIESRCDGVNFTIPSGNYEIKRIQRKNGTYYANPKKYPMCFAKEASTDALECGGNFVIPAGTQTLDGNKTLCFVRSRVTSSDFERAKRQQIIIQGIKDKLLSSDTLTSFDKINQLLDNLGNNVRSDFEPWEMKRLFDIYKEMPNMQIYQRVLENSEEGLLYNPPANGAGYILLPIGDNYNRIHEMAKNIFNLPPQSDIKPKN